MRIRNFALRNGITSKLSESGRFIQLTEQFIKMASPDYILKRGYSLALKDGKIIKHASDLRAGEELTTRFIDGEIKKYYQTIEGGFYNRPINT